MLNVFSGSNGELLPTKIVTSSASYFYTVDLSDNDNYQVQMSDESDTNGIFFAPSKMIIRTQGGNSGFAVATVETSKVCNSTIPVIDFDIPAFIRTANIVVDGITEVGGRLTLEVSFRRRDISKHKQVIHTV